MRVIGRGEKRGGGVEGSDGEGWKEAMGREKR